MRERVYMHMHTCVCVRARARACMHLCVLHNPHAHALPYSPLHPGRGWHRSLAAIILSKKT